MYVVVNGDGEGDDMERQSHREAAAVGCQSISTAIAESVKRHTLNKQTRNEGRRSACATSPRHVDRISGVLFTGGAASTLVQQRKAKCAKHGTLH
jgi:hypothetical protein